MSDWTTPSNRSRVLDDRLDAPLADRVADRADHVGGGLDVEVGARNRRPVVVGRGRAPEVDPSDRAGRRHAPILGGRDPGDSPRVPWDTAPADYSSLV